MKLNCLKIILCITALLYISGCTSAYKTVKTTALHHPASNGRGNHYSYYIESHLHKKKDNIEKAVFCLKKAIEADPESLYLKKELAFLYMRQQENEKALSIAEKILKERPDDVQTLIIFGRLKQKLNLNSDAIAAYEKVIEINPEHEAIHMLLGGLYMDSNDLENALRVYEKMVKNHPESYAGFFFLGRIYARNGDVKNAEKNFLKTLEIKPELVEPRLELVDLYRNEDMGIMDVTVKPGDSLSGICLKIYKKFDDQIFKVIQKYNPELKNSDSISAGQKLRFPEPGLFEKKQTVYKQKIISIYKDILEIYPDDIRSEIELGYYYYLSGIKTEAEKIFKNLGKKSLSDNNVIAHVFNLFLNTKDFDAAKIILTGMLASAPDSPDIHYFTGLTFYEGEKDFDKALHHFKKVTPGSEFFESAAIHIAFIYQEQGKTTEAIDFLKDVIQKVPGNPEFMLYLGSIYEELEQFEKAEKILKKGIDIDKNNTKLYFRLGIVYDKWGNKKASAEQMRTVISLDPKDANALNYLGYTMADAGENLDEAERLIKEALKHMPDDGYITDSLGWVYFKKGRLKEAINVLEKAVSIVPDDPVILEHLGDAYWKMNNRKKALEFYRRSLEHKEEKDKHVLENKIRGFIENNL